MPEVIKKPLTEDKSRRSFDVFDTLIIRDVLDPKEVFRRVESALVAKNLPIDGFTNLRVKAERRSRDPRDRETTLDRIYTELAAMTGWDWDIIQKIKREEIRQELASVYPVGEAEGWLRTARYDGHEVLLLSDMYLPSATIRQMLERSGLNGLFDRIHVSGDTGQSKHNGRVYVEFRNSIVSWDHIGDNIFADVRQARRHGVEGTWKTLALPTLRECLLDADNSGDPLVAGLSRVARLSEKSAFPAFRAIGANVSGPVFFPFVRWVLEEALRKGLQRVYFLSRDGQLLCHIARILRESRPDYPLPLYLHGSRQAWLGPAFDPKLEGHVSLLFRDRDRSLRGVWSNLGLNPDDFTDVLAECGFSNNDWDRTLSRGEKGTLIHAMRSGVLTKPLSEALGRQHSFVWRYLVQEGVIGTGKVGLVDIGWKGSMQGLLEAILRKGTDNPPEVIGFNFGLEVAGNRDRQLAYAFQSTFLPNRLSLHPSVIEMLTPADHGQVIAFREMEDGSIRPALREAAVAPIEGIRELQAGALQFTSLAVGRDIGEIRSLPLLRAFLNRPTKEEVGVFRQFSFSTFQRAEEVEMDRLVPLLKPTVLLKLALHFDRRTDLWPWPEAALRNQWPSLPSLFLRLLQVKMLSCRMLHRILLKGSIACGDSSVNEKEC